MSVNRNVPVLSDSDDGGQNLRPSIVKASNLREQESYPTTKE